LEKVHEILYVASIIYGVKTREIREGWEKNASYSALSLSFSRLCSAFPSVVLMAWLQTNRG
jgi:hypothetical protein